MASVQSPIRKILKPLIYKILGPQIYQYFNFRAKWRDIEFRLVEEPEMALLPKFLRPDDVCIDVGANYAYYTVRLGQLCPQGKVYAFEPIPATFATAKKLVEKAGLKNIELIAKGVGEKEESLEFEVPLQEIGTHSAGQAHMKGRNNALPGKEKYHPFQSTESFTCQVIPLDSLDFPKLRFIKIDIEGAELFALKGMRKLLAKHKPLLFLEICEYFLKGFGITLESLLEEIRHNQYEIYEFDAALGKVKKSQIPPAQDKNYILLPKDRLQDFKDIL